MRKTIIDRGTIDAIQEESAQYQNEQFIDKEQNKNRELSICSDIQLLKIQYSYYSLIIL